MDFSFTIFGDAESTLVALMVFLATAILTFAMMAMVRVHGAVRRRTAGINETLSDQGTIFRQNARQRAGFKAAEKIIGYAQKHYGDGDSKDMKVLRKRLVLAGLYDPRSVAVFFLARAVLAIGLSIVAMMFGPSDRGSVYWMIVGGAGLFGYLAPSLYLDRRIAARREEHRAGFPDFMDLLVVCADAGLSMEAALDRVGRELAASYPSLCANIHMANLEIRAGRTMTEALEHLAERLGLEEARSFATLIQQSEELGSSITEALRVYSDDMRHKRLSRAEEKAYSLPAKLSLPMMVCIFPVLFVVILLPVAVRVITGSFQ
ncbi:MAG: type II secretion system F family protein [Pseudomonadota bacterium]